MDENEFTFIWIEFQKLYWKLAKQWHPDLQPVAKREKATRRMQWLNRLYDKTRKAYLDALEGMV